MDVWLGDTLHHLEDRDIMGLNTSMVIVSFFGATGSLLVTAGVALYCFRRRSWPELLLWLIAIGGIILLNRLLKDAFETLRPMVGHRDRFEESTGFPSGHAMAAVGTYGLLAYFALAHSSTRTGRVASLLGAGSLIMLISASRLFLALHYLSDVLGGLAAGIAWLGVCLWFYERNAAGVSGLVVRSFPDPTDSTDLQ